jgi:hypothetical protein
MATTPKFNFKTKTNKCPRTWMRLITGPRAKAKALAGERKLTEAGVFAFTVYNVTDKGWELCFHTYTNAQAIKVFNFINPQL